MVLALGTGCVVGLATGGRLQNLAHVRIRRWPLLLAAVAAQLAAAVAPRGVRGAVAFGCCMLVTAWSLANRAQGRLVPGMVALAIGLAANAVVIAANGGMPVDTHALASAGFAPTLDVARGHLYKHVVMTGATRLSGLGDIIPIRLFRTVASPGDAVMLLGVLLTAWGATTLGTRGGGGAALDERATPGTPVAA